MAIRRLPSNVTDLSMCLIQLTLHLARGGSVTSFYIRERYGVSVSTAKRYVAHLERAIPLEVSREARHKNDRHPPKVLRLMTKKGRA